MKSIKKGLLLFLLVIVLTVIGSSTFGWIGGIVGFLMSLVILVAANRATVMFVVGQLRYNKDDHIGAYRLMKKAYDTTKLAPGFTLMYAYMMIRDGMLTEAETVLNKVTYLNRRELTKEDLALADINKAIIMWKQDRLSEGIELLEDVYESGMKSTTLYGTLGYFYILDNRIEKALEFNKEAYEYNSDNMIIADNLALNYILNSELEKAEEMYKMLLERNPSFIEPYYNYALLLEKRMQNDEALEYYNKALEYPEKYLSTITHKDVNEAIERLGGTVEVNDEPDEDLHIVYDDEIEADTAEEILPETEEDAATDTEAEDTL
jgi:tetratricopeptide (TPR) repeat protein